jgi:hypothetical protein
MSATKTPAKVGDPLAFYEVAATIIPVLFLGLIYQGQIVDKLDIHFYRFYVAFLTALIAFGGEAAALGVLTNQQPTLKAQRGVGSILLLLGLGLLVQPVLVAIKPMDDELDARVAELEATDRPVSFALRWLRMWRVLVLTLLVGFVAGILLIYHA